jgi:hypothetical protein
LWTSWDSPAIQGSIPSACQLSDFWTWIRRGALAVDGLWKPMEGRYAAIQQLKQTQERLFSLLGAGR